MGRRQPGTAEAFVFERERQKRTVSRNEGLWDRADAGFMAVMERDVIVLWYAIFKGELCRLRRSSSGGLLSEAWRDGFWVKGPDFGERDFTGRSISPEEADAWIRARFKEKLIGRSVQRQVP